MRNNLWWPEKRSANLKSIDREHGYDCSYEVKLNVCAACANGIQIKLHL